MVAAAVVGGSALGAGASIWGANKASGAQKDAANRANDTQWAMYNQNREDLSPYRQAGSQALNQWNALMGINSSGNTDPMLMQKTLESLPGYQFALGQGLKSAQNGFAARGLGSSGAAMKGAASYATGLANQNFGNYANMLMGGAQLGENAAAQTGAFGTQAATNIGNNLIGAGNAQAAAYNSMGNSINNMFGNLGGMYLTNSMMKAQGYPSLFGGG